MDAVELVQKCWTHVQHGKLPPSHLISLLVSKALGYGILCGALIIKFPQIIGILQAKSAEGLSPFSYELESIGYAIHTSYGYVKQLPFSAYGEASFMAVQNLLLLALVYHYSGASWLRGAASFGTFAALLAAALSGNVSQDVVAHAYELNTVIFTAARVPQIVANYRAGSTGRLSFLTSFLNFAGASARIFTTLREGGGSSMLRGFVIGAFVNFILVAQIVYYNMLRGNKSGKKKAADDRKTR